MAQLPLGDHDPSRIVQVIGDITPEAYGPDARITITPSGDRFTYQQGQDGHMIRIRNRAIMHTVVFTLMRSDPANDALWELLKTDLESPDGAGIVKYSMVDNNGTEKASAPQCWIAREPDLAYTATGEQTRTWTLHLGSAEIQVGSLKQF